MIRLTVLTGVVTALLFAVRGLSFPLSDVWEPTITCLALLAVGAFYRFVRPAANFVLTTKALAVLVGFSTLYAMLMYAIATCGRPLVDASLARADETLGLSAPATVAWANARPAIAWILWAAYFSLIPQTILVIVWLGLRGRSERLDTFLVRFMLASLITAVGFFFWPAAGTYGSVYNLAVPDYCTTCFSDLCELRSGAQTLITWRGSQGLITFPSFHTIWALLLAGAFVGSRLFWPLALLNALVVFSTVTTGMHYYTDVIAGIAVTLVVIAATRISAEQPAAQTPELPSRA
jgi:membrane-associated phospholipid phosphatase